MVCVEDICIWFKNLEGEARIELMCSLLDICLPLELRFLGTYLEFIASKNYAHLQRWEKTANDGPFEERHDLSDTKVRRTLCIFLTLLYSHNRKMATRLFQILTNFDAGILKYHCGDTNGNSGGTNNSTPETVTYINEIRLLLCMASHHPAFDFNQKQKLRDIIELLHQDKRENCDKPISKQGITETNQRNESPVKERNYFQVPKVASTSLNKASVKAELENLCNAVQGKRNDSNVSQEEYLARGTKMKSDVKPARTEALVCMPTNVLGGYYRSQPSSPQVAHIASQALSNVPLSVLTSSAFKPGSPVLQGAVLHPQSKAVLHTGANGVIQSYFQPAIYNQGNNPASGVSTFSPLQGDYSIRCPSAPIPVRTSHVYQQYPQPSYQSIRGNSIPFSCGVSPLDSPCHSPYTSPLPSPITSPRPSPAQSPMFRRKSTGGIGSNKKDVQNFASVYDWLKSLRLHKYKDVFKDYTFEKMASLTESDLIDLGLTQGARKKFKLNVDALIEKGFQGFGSQPMFSAMRHNTLADNIINGIISIAPDHSPQQGYIHSELGTRPDTAATGNDLCFNSRGEFNSNVPIGMNSHSTSSRTVKTQDTQFLKESNYSEKSSDEASQGTEESFDDFVSDDEVFLTRRQTVIEIQTMHPEKNELQKDKVHSCYNCGEHGHPGNECNEDTMEMHAYSRYGYRLHYDIDAGKREEEN